MRTSMPPCFFTLVLTISLSLLGASLPVTKKVTTMHTNQRMLENRGREIVVEKTESHERVMNDDMSRTPFGSPHTQIVKSTRTQIVTKSRVPSRGGFEPTLSRMPSTGMHSIPMNAPTVGMRQMGIQAGGVHPMDASSAGMYPMNMPSSDRTYPMNMPSSVGMHPMNMPSSGERYAMSMSPSGGMYPTDIIQPMHPANMG